MSIATKLSTFDDPAGRRELLVMAGFPRRLRHRYTRWCPDFVATFIAGASRYQHLSPLDCGGNRQLLNSHACRRSSAIVAVGGCSPSS